MTRSHYQRRLSPLFSISNKKLPAKNRGEFLIERKLLVELAVLANGIHEGIGDDVESLGVGMRIVVEVGLETIKVQLRSRYR